jgi:trimeric autotransporter adhesin
MRHFNWISSRRRFTVCQLGSLFCASAGLAIAQQYTVTTVAGGAPPFTPVAALNISIGLPTRAATDASGNLYFTSLNCVFRLDGGGNLTRVAGNSRAGFSGDGGLATQAQLNTPAGLALDSSGDIFVADSGNNRVREITANGMITTIAGNGSPGFLGDGFAAVGAELLSPSGVAVDGSGNVYIADTGNSVVREVTAGIINTIAGGGFRGFAGDAGPANQSLLAVPEDVAVGSNGTIYIADTGNASVRAITPGTINKIPVLVINTVAGNATIGFSGDGGPATSASMSQPWAIAVDSSGNLYIDDFGNDRIRMVNTKGIINTVAGTGTIGFSGDGSAATSATLNMPTGIALDTSGNLYIADSWNFRVRKVASSNISTVAGNGLVSYSGDGGPAMAAELYYPQGVGIDRSGNLFISDTGNGVMRQVSAKGVITTMAGVTVKYPQGIAVDQAGNVYVADSQANLVREIGVNGSFTTFAGNGSAGYSGDGGPATSAELNGPTAVAVDAAGNVYIADYHNQVIRMVSAGVISTVAGNATAGYSGDGGPATQASLDSPQGVAVDAAGNLYIADTANHVVRKVTAGTISTIAGTGAVGFTGDGGPAIDAQLISPRAIATDPFGNVFFIDGGNRIREIYSGGYINTIAGNGTAGYSGDFGVATSAQFNGPTALSIDSSGNIYVADTANNAIRLLQPTGSGISLETVTNGASNLPGPIAPGEIVVLWGSGMGPASLQVYQLPLSGLVPTNVAGTSVFFDGIPAPIIYTSTLQVAAVVPFAITGTHVQVFVQYQNQTSPALEVAVAPAAPALFTTDEMGQGQAVAFNHDQTANNAGNPAAPGSLISLFATGFGQTSPAGTDGLPTTTSPPLAILPVTVTIGGQPAQLSFAGGVPGVVAGMMEVTVQVPAGLQPTAAAAVTLQVGDAVAPGGVTVAISK